MPKNGLCSRWASCWASGQFCFDYPYPHASPGKAPMQTIMELDLFQPEVHHPLHNLPNWFKEADTPIFPTSFWD